MAAVVAPGPVSGDDLRSTGRTALVAGTVLAGRYRLGLPLGRGGFGITYDAHDDRLDRPVAVKELFPEGARREGTEVVVDPQRAGARWDDARARFRREATTLARFAHPNIVRVFAVLEAYGTLYLVLERLEGRTLAQELRRRRGPFTEAEALDVAAQVGAALAVVHRAGVLHRDVSPANLVRTADGRVVLIDFGLARPYEHDRTTSMTRVVTPGYASPEQHRGAARFSARSDVYALGASLHRLLTGAVPPTPGQRLAGSEPAAVWRVNPTVRREVSDAVADALALDPGDRPADVPALLARLGVVPAADAVDDADGPTIDVADRATEVLDEPGPEPVSATEPEVRRSWVVPAPAADRAPGPAGPPPAPVGWAPAPVAWEPVAPGPVRPARRGLVALPLGALAVALAVAQPVTMTFVLGLIVAPTLATIGDRVQQPHRHLALLPTWWCRNLLVALPRTIGPAVVLGIGVGAWAVADAIEFLNAAAPWLLRATGVATGWLLAAAIGRGGRRFRSDLAVDRLTTRLVPDGRVTVVTFVFLLVVAGLVAGLLAFQPEAWPLR